MTLLFRARNIAEAATTVDLVGQRRLLRPALETRGLPSELVVMVAWQNLDGLNLASLHEFTSEPKNDDGKTKNASESGRACT